MVEEAMGEDIIMDEAMVADEYAVLAATGVRVTPAEAQICWAKARAAGDRVRRVIGVMLETLDLPC